jgi:F-type H+-transporting ATPase subunit b
MYNAEFWLAISFFIMVIVGFKPLKKLVLTQLDNRTSKIKAELSEAETVKIEAEAVLAKYKLKFQGQEQEVKEILESAQAQSQMLLSTAEHNIAESFDRRLKLATIKIEQQHNSLINNMLSDAIEQATNVAKQLVGQKLNSDLQQQLIEHSKIEISKSSKLSS